MRSLNTMGLFFIRDHRYHSHHRPYFRSARTLLTKCLRMSVVLAVIALVLLPLRSRAAEQRVRIPDGCRELAGRVGLPLTLTHAEATRAVAYLQTVISHDPAIVRCRLALRGWS